MAAVVEAGIILQMLIAIVAKILALRNFSASEFGFVMNGADPFQLWSVVAALGLGVSLTHNMTWVGDERKLGLTETDFGLTAITSVILWLAASLGAQSFPTSV